MARKCTFEDKNFTLKENSALARLGAMKLRSRKMALTLGTTIHLYNTTPEEFLDNKRWVKHELKHVEQYQRFGTPGFLCRYLWESIRKGYYNNRFEVEARRAETE